ncbi:actin [Tritrichomonas musculus]|uniref:Actin n=1 Tax=Tritrichomonas musculus TaxID=1915356 RepID=A0ABR2HYA0_9EUKA
MTEHEVLPVIIDNGSGTIKAGISGESEPQFHFSTTVGVAKYPVVLTADTHRDYYISNQDFAKAGVLNISYPIHHGIINDWDGIEKIWHQIIYKDLKVEPGEHPFFFVDSQNYTIEQREKIASIIFEKFNAPSIYFQSDATLNLLAAGRTSGLIVSSGEGITSITAIFEDYKIPQASQLNKMAGGTLTSYLIKKLGSDNLSHHTSVPRIIAQEIKETLCYAAEDYQAELQKAKSGDSIKQEYTYPDNQKLSLNELRFKVPEFFFHPHIWGCELKGIHQLIFESIMKSDLHVRKELYSNIILAGGNTMFPGFEKRLEKELSGLAPSGVNINVYAPPERKYAAWIGASFLSKFAQFPKMVITRNEFNEEGQTAISKKCP